MKKNWNIYKNKQKPSAVKKLVKVLMFSFFISEMFTFAFHFFICILTSMNNESTNCHLHEHKTNLLKTIYNCFPDSNKSLKFLTCHNQFYLYFTSKGTALLGLHVFIFFSIYANMLPLLTVIDYTSF